MEYKYKVDKEGFKGEIKLKIPNGIEKLGIAKDCVYFINESGELKERNPVDASIKLMEELKKRIIDLDIKAEGCDFKNFDDLSYDEVGFEILSELGKKLVAGFRLGKI